MQLRIYSDDAIDAVVAVTYLPTHSADALCYLYVLFDSLDFNNQVTNLFSAWFLFDYPLGFDDKITDLLESGLHAE